MRDLSVFPLERFPASPSPGGGILASCATVQSVKNLTEGCAYSVVCTQYWLSPTLITRFSSVAPAPSGLRLQKVATPAAKRPPNISFSAFRVASRGLYQ